jgi:hypothetical protein
MSDAVLVNDHPAANESKHARADGKRTKAVTGGQVADGGKVGGEWKFQKNPQFLKSRVEFFDSLLKTQ